MNVLIVDDQPDVVEGLKDGVKWKELPVKEIYCACSAEEARELLEKNKIHIVLCDNYIHVYYTNMTLPTICSV